MSMQSIDFNSGNYKEYAINGDENRVIRINVSDVGIITRIQDAMSNADNIAEEVSEREKNEDRTQLLKEYDQRVREMVNDIFGSDVCTAALGSVNVFSVASNGKPVLVNFLEALLAVVVQEIKSDGCSDKARRKGGEVHRTCYRSSTYCSACGQRGGAF